MENKLEIFKNDEFGVIRTIEENGKVLFCGSDVAKALGYANPNKAINDHCRAITKRDTPISGKIQEINYIGEGDVYRLVTHSKLPSAEKFESWVFDEVLPTIRKHGEYKIPKTPMETLELMFQVQKENAEKIEKLDTRVYEIEENSPLNPGEYNLINTKVSERIRNIKRELGIERATREQNSELYRAINSEIKSITGVRTRSQLRQKDLDKVLDFIRDWEPSKATRVILNQLSLNLEM